MAALRMTFTFVAVPVTAAFSNERLERLIDGRRASISRPSGKLLLISPPSGRAELRLEVRLERNCSGDIESAVPEEFRFEALEFVVPLGRGADKAVLNSESLTSASP